MSTGHTPGPWLYRGKSDSVHRPSETHPYGETIFRFDDEESPFDEDLNLILAAPELLEALQDVESLGLLPPSLLIKARAAITKATGETP
jgi:hypothetical protein